MATQLILLLALYCALFSAAQAHQVRNSAIAGSDPAVQTCGTQNFYCPVDRMCKPRTQRCTGANICFDQSINMEPECHETSIDGKYLIQLGHVTLGNPFSKKAIGLPAFEHQFVTFRGFTYEFGKNYQVQILDITDPEYKYINGKDLNSNGIEEAGSSYCTREDATMFANEWDTKYNVLINNCQFFASAMIKFLKNGPCNQSPQSRVKRQENQDVQAYIGDLLSDCSVVCCDANGSASSPSAAASTLVTAIAISTYSILKYL